MRLTTILTLKINVVNHYSGINGCKVKHETSNCSRCIVSISVNINEYKF